MILSEFSTATSVLNSNLVVNPWNIRMVARELDKALNMEDHERSFRQWRDYQYAIRNPSAAWSRTCIADVVEIRAERTWPGGAPPPHPAAGAEAAALSGLQAAAEVERSPVPLLGAAAVARAFCAARRRLLVLDYGGTLVTRSHVVGEATGRQARLGFQLDGYAENLPSDVAAALARLATDPDSFTYLVSGLRSTAIQALLVAQTPQIGLAAENGMFVSHPSYEASAAGATQPPECGAPAAAEGGGTTAAPGAAARRWVSMSPADAARMAEWQGVKQRAVSVMTDYVWRVNGSAVLEYDSLVAWDFRNADPEWALSQARFLAQDLEQQVLAESPQNVKVTVRKSRVEVCLRAMDKGTVVTELLRRLGDVDFVLCVGDDATDEDMFAAVGAWRITAAAAAAAAAAPAPALFSATVGKKTSTAAASYLADVAGVQQLIVALDRAAAAAAAGVKAS